MSHLSNKQLQQLSKQLKQEKQDVESHFEQEDQESLRDSLGELSLNDNHPGDSGTELFERSRDLAIHAAEQSRLDEINEALLRIESGTYGECTVCKQNIPYDRLEALPWTTTCVTHSIELENRQARPIEEDVMEPGRGAAPRDYVSEPNNLDDNESWRTLEAFGNSDSPAMVEDPDTFQYSDSEREADGDGSVHLMDDFSASDIDGKNKRAIRNDKYEEYLNKNEGEPGFEDDQGTKRDG